MGETWRLGEESERLSVFIVGGEGGALSGSLVIEHCLVST